MPLQQLRLEQWMVIAPNDLDRYSAPEMIVPHLAGLVYGHPRSGEYFQDGTFIHTSPIVGKNKEDMVITKSGHAYALGEVDPAYEQRFHDAKDRLLKTLQLLGEERSRT